MHLIQAYLDTEETVTYDDVKCYRLNLRGESGAHVYIERADGSEVYLMRDHLVVFVIVDQEEKEDE